MFERMRASTRPPAACDDVFDATYGDDEDAAFERLLQQAVATSATPFGRCAGHDLRVLAPGTLLGDRYEVVRLLGSGGMGVVFAGRDRKTGGKPVAIKWLRNEPSHVSVTRRFLREALAAGPIVHPHVVSILDVGFHLERPYLVMELLEGEPLSDRIARGRIPLDDALAIARGVLRGVAAAHARGIVHRDLKPGNVFLCHAEHARAPTPKVLDFGIAKLSAEHFGRLTLTDPDLMLGTPRYMAPEMIRGEAVDARTDLYSVSVLLYAMLTGMQPFDAPSEYELYRRILQGDVAPLRVARPDLPVAVAAVVARGMAVDPRERFGSADEMLQALQGDVPRARGRIGLAGLAVAAGAMLLLAALLAVYLAASASARALPRLPSVPELGEAGD